MGLTPQHAAGWSYYRCAILTRLTVGDPTANQLWSY